MTTLCAAAACARPGEAPPVHSNGRISARAVEAIRDSAVRARPGYVVDSILPVEEELRRFRVGLARAPTELRGGATSREALVRRFATAIRSKDTTSLRHMMVDRAEFAYLLYPGSASTRPPYRQSPQIVWLLLSAQSNKGLRRLLARLGGDRLRVEGHECDRQPAREAGTLYWRNCRVRWSAANGARRTGRLFGAIIERDGRFKFGTYENAF